MPQGFIAARLSRTISNRFMYSLSRGVLVRRCAEQRGDFLCRQTAARSAGELGEVQRAEAAFHAVHAAVIRKGVVILHENHGRPRLAHACLDARAKRGGKFARQRT